VRVAPADDFEQLRASLFAVAYRMLGSAADAEDVVQDAGLRWLARPPEAGTAVESPRAYLTTVVTRLCIDHLRSARVRREAYKGPWLPEPIEEEGPDPAEQAALADSLSMAFLVLLEELGPVERAAFLLHDVFDYPYDEVGRILERSEPACRQLVARARRRVSERRHRFDADRDHGRELTRRFATACLSGDLQGLIDLLADDVVVLTDGGGKVRAALRPVVGAHRASRFLLSVTRRIAPGTEGREAVLNGQPGMVFTLDGTVTIALALEVLDGRIVGVQVVTNPDKLHALNDRSPGDPGDA